MKLNIDIVEIPKTRALALIQSTHYSKVMPKLTRYYLGGFVDGKLVGVLTLGWGTQPLQTIRKLFPSLVTEDYLEIGKLCMLDEMPKNSETQFMSAVNRWIRANCPDKKFLYTWADGIVGKPGYVYQAANFYYGGYIWTDVYIAKSGEKIHPRSARQLLRENVVFEQKRNPLYSRNRLYWLTFDFMESKGISRIKGKQFRYILPLNKSAKKMLKHSTTDWTKNYPKHKDLLWKIQVGKGRYKELRRMPKMDLSVTHINKRNVFRNGGLKAKDHDFWE